MSEIKLFQISGAKVCEIAGQAGGLERSLQSLIERNLETMLGARFLHSEYVTGKTHGGRIDTLGLDENGCPVIIEYKRAVSENVINQGLFYLDWLMDHKADFKLLVLDSIGKDAADDIDWSSPRLICIASDFTSYDEHAVKQINRNIDLIRYRRFGDQLLAMELVHRTSAGAVVANNDEPTKRAQTRGTDKPVKQAITEMEAPMRDLYEALRAYLLGLGEDVQEKQAKLYMVYRRIKNFACVIVQKNALIVTAKVDPTTLKIESGFTRDVSNIGHWGTGDLEITIRNREDLRRAEPLIARSYEGA